MNVPCDRPAVRFDPGASLFDLLRPDDLQALLGVGVDVVSEGGLGRSTERSENRRAL